MKGYTLRGSQRNILLLGLLIYMVSVVYASSTSTYTYSMRGDTHSLNNLLGYRLETANSTVGQDDLTGESTDSNVYHAIRVFTVDTNGSLTEVTSGYSAEVVRSINNEGLQSAVWNCPGASNSADDVLLVRVYRKFDDSYTLRVSFVSNRLNARLSNSTWSIYYYTSRNFTGAITYGSFSWGNSSVYSRVENVALESFTLWEWQDYFLKQGDFVLFLLTPYVNPLGEIAYGLFILLVSIPIYNRTENLNYVMVLFILFGGVSGLFTMLIPTAGLNLANVLMIVGISVLLFKLIMSTRT